MLGVTYRLLCLTLSYINLICDLLHFRAHNPKVLCTHISRFTTLFYFDFFFFTSYLFGLLLLVYRLVSSNFNESWKRIDNEEKLLIALLSILLLIAKYLVLNLRTVLWNPFPEAN